MTDGLYPDADLARLDAEMVCPAVVALVAEDAPTRRILLAGAGSFEQANITMTQGVFLGESQDVAADLAAQLDAVADRRGEMIPANGAEQYQFEAARARRDAQAAA